MKKSNNSLIDGVCAGIGEHFGIDPIWVRLIFVFGQLGFLYIILMWIMEEPSSGDQEN